MPPGLHTVGLAEQSSVGNDVMDDLAFKGIHGSQRHRLTGLLDGLHGLGGEDGEFLASILPEPCDVEHQP